jgi:pimeloyl-ACP methyl ester carboxylesterase
MNARSFVVRIPKSVLPVSGSWKVRLAAGVADATDSAFAPVSQSDGALPGQPAVYNMAFRSYLQEPPVYKPSGDLGELEGNGLARGSKYGNFWMERHQSDALSSGDVSAFALDVSWAELADKESTPEPEPTGYTNRWYVSRLNLGQGVIANPSNSGTGDLRPNFLGRIQPYAVDVPTTFDRSARTPLTWILHSLSVQHNQYGALDPSMIQQECEDRHSICATTLGYGPDGWYFDEAESDFWQVWHQLALTYPLDPERTVISGYSMGGFASYKLGLEYPDLFAKAMPLAGPPECGLFIAESAGGAAGSGRCTTAGDTTPMIVNARWVPYVLGDGVEDELVPVTSVLQQVKTFLDDGNRIHFELYPAEDHLVFATQDGFSNEIAQLGTTTRVANPGHITYAWYPTLADPKLGLGPTGAYWVRGLAGRTGTALATVDVQSNALPNPAITPTQAPGADVPGDPTPALVVDQTWTLGATPKLAATMVMTLTNVSSLGVDMARAALVGGGRIAVTTDGLTTLRLLNLRPGLHVAGGTAPVTVGSDGVAVVHVASGSHTLTVH